MERLGNGVPGGQGGGAANVYTIEKHRGQRLRKRPDGVFFPLSAGEGNHRRGPKKQNHKTLARKNLNAFQLPRQGDGGAS